MAKASLIAKFAPQGNFQDKMQQQNASTALLGESQKMMGHLCAPHVHQDNIRMLLEKRNVKLVIMVNLLVHQLPQHVKLAQRVSMEQVLVPRHVDFVLYVQLTSILMGHAQTKNHQMQHVLIVRLRVQMGNTLMEQSVMVQGSMIHALVVVAPNVRRLQDVYPDFMDSYRMIAVEVILLMESRVKHASNVQKEHMSPHLVQQEVQPIVIALNVQICLDPVPNIFIYQHHATEAQPLTFLNAPLVDFRHANLGST
jgi:hypothetical protein